jgi:WD40 repeat protein
MDTSQNNTTQGGVTLGGGASITLGAGDVVGRDKIVNNIQNIQQRALTAVEEAEQGRSFEAQKLAQGVGAFVGRLQTIASQKSNTEVVMTLQGHKNNVAAIAWSPDGASLASGGEDRLIQVLRTEYVNPPCEWLARNLTLTESVIYFGDEDHARTCENLAEGE